MTTQPFSDPTWVAAHAIALAAANSQGLHHITGTPPVALPDTTGEASPETPLAA